ncbi:MAG: T9SS type A sorting domain-containing protein [Haliscomenobacter sp.]|nr:T9SS type A sorting domain-containing protein [Haliscomenobacter sp.]MBK8653726.1 T9SS type A sorting domain-containing protein [Haliscomenobacter sp.]MBP9873342.1 T9SS type A sorting domain-containing protein [Haliscomenobacter sp.]
MKRIFTLSVIAFFALSSFSLTGQSLKFQRRILVTDTITDNAAKIAVSSDDAEQENQEIDALYDDDIDAGWEGAPEDRNILTAGMRFRLIAIPKGARIDSAFVIVYSHEGKSKDDVAKITIVGDANDNAPTFTEDSLIDKRAKTAASVLWEVKEEWKLWQPYRTPDLKAVVQEIVDRPGWEAGNALALVFLGQDQGPSEVENAREWESFENIADPSDGGDGQNHPERRPELVIYYSVSGAKFEMPIQVTDTITDNAAKIAVSSDDAEQENQEIDALYDDDIDAGWEGAPEDRNILTAGIRFRNIDIPKGAVIDSAYVVVFSHEGKSKDDVAKITIVGDANDNAPTFTEDSLIDKRAKTAASVLWEVKEEWKLWQPYRTPDLKAVVQEIIDRPGWTAGNALALVFLGQDQGPSEVENAREWESFENIADPSDGGDGQNHPERRPRLVIHYSSPSKVTGTRSVLAQEVGALKIFPNPVAEGSVMVEMGNEEPALIRMFNSNGQLVRTLKTDGGKTVAFSFGNQPAGLYYLQASQAQKWYIQKLVIEN